MSATVAARNGLRHTFITMVGKTGVSAREHMDLARHSSYSMTARYSHSRFYDLAAAVNGLPSLVPEGHAPEALAATGTTGNSLGPFLGPQREKTGYKLGETGTEAKRPEKQKSPEKPAIPAVFQGKDISDRNRFQRVPTPPSSH